MALQSGRVYEIRIYNTEATWGLTSAKWDYFRFWSPDLWNFEGDFGTEPIPLSDAGAFVGGGYRQPRSVQLIGSYTGNIGLAAAAYPEYSIDPIIEVFDNLSLYRDTTMYLDVETAAASAGSVTARRILFVKPKRWRWVPKEGTRYTMGEVLIDFVSADPNFYEYTLRTCSASASAASALVLIDPSVNTFALSRYTIKVENTNGSTLSNVSASSYADSMTWYLTDSISASGDYWLIDHGNMTVRKYVSGVGSNAISAFHGSFFPLAGGDVVNIVRFDCLSTSATTDDYKVTIQYRRVWDYAM